MPRLSSCDHCGGPTEFAAEIQQLGRQPGYRVLFCAACDRHTWAVWHSDEQADPLTAPGAGLPLPPGPNAIQK